MLVGKVSALWGMLLVFRVMASQAMLFGDQNPHINAASVDSLPDLQVMDPLLQDYFKTHEQEILQNMMNKLAAPRDAQPFVLDTIKCVYTNVIRLVKLFRALKNGNWLRAALLLERMGCLWSLPKFLHDNTSPSAAQNAATTTNFYDVLHTISSDYPELAKALTEPTSLRLSELQKKAGADQGIKENNFHISL